MTFQDSIEADIAVLRGRAEEAEEIAVMVESAWQEENPSTDEWEATGLDREKLAALAEKIRGRSRLRKGV